MTLNSSSVKPIKSLLIWTLLIISISKVQSAEMFLQLELIEEKQRISLSIDGICQTNGSFGYLIESYFQDVWHQLTTDLAISQLSRTIINKDINQAMKRTGIIVIEDGAQLTRLKLTTDKGIRQIDIYGLLGLVNNYPKANNLQKFYDATLLLKNVSESCLVNDKHRIKKDKTHE